MVDILATTNNSVSLFNSSLALPKGSVLSLRGNAKIIGRKYKSGALYHGQIRENKRNGDGTFQWPSGIVYQGDYLQNLRHGSGKHTWQDGSRYTGSFHLDARQGKGEIRWADGELFDGQFQNDKKHGQGKYMWSDGSFYEGYFRADKKWGFGKFNYPDGSKFEGFYLDDRRHGPGVLSYMDGKQDVGIWDGEHLLSLCTVAENKFDLGNIGQHSINSAMRGKFEMTLKPKDISAVLETLCEELQMNREDMVRQVPAKFLPENILCGRRENFSQKGLLEVLSENLLEAALEGDFARTKWILATQNVSPDVSDFTGHFPLLSASVNCHLNIINILLDYGANVNKLNDEGMSALSACHVLLYTEDTFVDNIAESMMAENLFNLIEWDKQKSVVSLRNERQMILSVYELNRVKSGRATASKKKRPASRLVSISSSSSAKELVSSPTADDGHSDEDGEVELERNEMDSWKLNYFHETIARLEQLNTINENFQKLPMPCQDYPLRKASPPTVSTPLLESRNSTPNRDDEISVTIAEEDYEKESDQISISRQSLCDFAHLEVKRKTALTRKLQALRRKLINSERKPHLESVINLLLSRGANPNTSTVPLPSLFYAVKTGNVKAVESLLKKGADPLIRLESENYRLMPLHIAAALPRREGIEITRLLLEAGADPDARDEYFGEQEEGRTPLHLACCREDNYKESRHIVDLLLSYDADPNLICHAHTPLTLAISSGNDLAIDSLLKQGADPSLPLPRGVGSALCAATTFAAERRRRSHDRLKLVDKLVKAGGDLLAPVVYSEKLGPGTVVDYAHFVFNQDRRIAHTPYHALNAAERECHNCRKEMLDHLGELLRTAALRRENEMIENELARLQDTDASSYVRSDTTKQGVTFNLTEERNITSIAKATNAFRPISRSSERESASRAAGCGLRFAPNLLSGSINRRRLEAKRKFRYCYECGRSVGLRLTACSRCKEVFFCSKPCKLKAWSARHKEECTRIAGSSSKSPKPRDTELPPISKGKKGKGHRINNYLNSSKYCLCELKKPEC